MENIEVINKEYREFNHDVYRFDTLENEVIFVAESIAKLIDDGVNINNIFIANLDTNCYNVIKRIFNMYNIPININDKNNLYQTNIGKYFINNLSNDIEKIFMDIENKFDMNILKLNILLIMFWKGNHCAICQVEIYILVVLCYT